MREVVITSLLIMVFRMCDVSLATIRTILTTKGMPKIAAFIGFFELLIYIKVLGSVVSQLDNVIYLVAYATGFSLGTYFGIKMEKRFAFGNVQARIIINEEKRYIIDELRKKDFGVTVFKGEGRDGERLLVLITMKRKRLDIVMDYIESEGINAFISVNDVSLQKGGYSSGAVLGTANKRK